eukprot:1515125-Rhodomonas_salina.2
MAGGVAGGGSEEGEVDCTCGVECGGLRVLRVWDLGARGLTGQGFGLRGKRSVVESLIGFETAVSSRFLARSA